MEPNISCTVNSWTGLNDAAYFFRTAGLRGRIVLRGDLLALLGVQEVQVGLGQVGAALLGDGALHDGHRVLGHDGGRRVDGVDLARAELGVH